MDPRLFTHRRSPPIRYAIISDIHGNLEALTAALSAIDSMRPDKIVCLGDLVGSYANPNECVAMIRERRIPCVRGNHDEAVIRSDEPAGFTEAARRAILWTRKWLTPENRRTLDVMPTVQVIDQQFVISHAPALAELAEQDAREWVLEARDSLVIAVRTMPRLRVAFCGHANRPAVYECRGTAVSALAGEQVALHGTASYLINPGSVGLPSARDGRATFLTFDSDQGLVQFHRVAYPRTQAWRKAVRAGLLARPGIVDRSKQWVRDWVDAGKELMRPARRAEHGRDAETPNHGDAELG